MLQLQEKTIWENPERCGQKVTKHGATMCACLQIDPKTNGTPHEQGMHNLKRRIAGIAVPEPKKQKVVAGSEATQIQKRSRDRLGRRKEWCSSKDHLGGDPQWMFQRKKEQCRQCCPYCPILPLQADCVWTCAVSCFVSVPLHVRAAVAPDEALAVLVAVSAFVATAFVEPAFVEPAFAEPAAVE